MNYTILNNSYNRNCVIGTLLVDVIFFVTGCTVGPNYKPPQMEMPQEWQHSSEDVFSTVSDANNAEWWKIFADEDLDELVRQATGNNRDIKVAFYRVETSRALRDLPPDDIIQI